MFILKQGRTKFMDLPIAASVAIAKGSLVGWSSGTIVAVTTTSHPSTHIGVLAKASATTDADYAVARTIAVEVPVENATVWEADVTATLVVADVGLYCDLTNAYTVNRAASTYDDVQCVGFLTTTKGLFHLNLATSGIGNIIGA